MWLEFVTTSSRSHSMRFHIACVIFFWMLEFLRETNCNASNAWNFHFTKHTLALLLIRALSTTVRFQFLHRNKIMQVIYMKLSFTGCYIILLSWNSFRLWVFFGVDSVEQENDMIDRFSSAIRENRWRTVLTIKNTYNHNFDDYCWSDCSCWWIDDINLLRQ